MPSSNENSHVHVTGPRKGVGVFLGEMWEESINKSHQPCRVPQALSIFIYLGLGVITLGSFSKDTENQNNFAAQFSQERFQFLQIHVSCYFRLPGV